MSFLAPWMMAAGVLAAMGVFALHLLTTRRPPAVMLPTARFVPESEVRAVARASRPTSTALRTPSKSSSRLARALTLLSLAIRSCLTACSLVFVAKRRRDGGGRTCRRVISNK